MCKYFVTMKKLPEAPDVFVSNKLLRTVNIGELDR